MTRDKLPTGCRLCKYHITLTRSIIQFDVSTVFAFKTIILSYLYVYTNENWPPVVIRKLSVVHAVLVFPILQMFNVF